MSTNETFGRYRLGRRLGRGGMAEVHEASLEGHDGFVRRVALKRVRRELAAEPELVRMFSDEARIASHLHHANLVAVLDFGVHDGVPFQALELVEGASLEDLVAACAREARTIPEEIAIHVAREIAHGLAYAHRAKDAEGRALGLVHRDVSPSNVLVSEAGDVKLADFGIAFARSKEVETAHGVTRGKPLYMAPEQATHGTIDARTDLFALGCTLAYALSGKSPLEGDAVLMKLLVGEPAPLDPRLPEDLRALVASAVAPDRRARPASAEAFAEALDAAYRRRSDRDGRAALRAWIAPYARQLREQRRREEPPREEPPREEHEARAPEARSPQARSSETRAPEARSSEARRAAWVIGALVLGAGALVTLEWRSIARRPAAEAPLDAGRGDAAHASVLDAGRSSSVNGAPDVPDAPDAASSSAGSASAGSSSAGSSSDGSASAGSASGGLATATHPRETAGEAAGETASEHAPRQPPERTPTQPAEPVVEAPSAMGWARIVAGCERARDGAVSIDGRALGEHVPTARRLAAGRHTVVVSTADGARFEGSVEITEFHTEGRPAWFRACE